MFVCLLKHSTLTYESFHHSITQGTSTDERVLCLHIRENLANCIVRHFFSLKRVAKISLVPISLVECMKNAKENTV